MSEHRICPVTGRPCEELRVYEITENKGDASFTVKCCRKCAVLHVEDLNKRAKSQDLPLLPSTMDFLNTLIGDLGVLKMETTELGLVIPIQTNDQSKIIVKNLKPTDHSCPGCGFTINDILGTGKVGCPQCYEFYRAEMGDIIPEAFDHSGKTPKKKLKQEEVDKEALLKVVYTQLQSLQKKLEAAVRDEDYETAAILRDQISKLQRKHGI